MRPEAKALRSVRTIASWPISSAKTFGRYLRGERRMALGRFGYGGRAAPSAFGLAGRFPPFSRCSTSAMDGRYFQRKGLAAKGRLTGPRHAL